MNDYENKKKSLETLTGVQLSSVCFVMDYVQLHFDGPVITAYTWPYVSCAAQRISFQDGGYRDALCALIAQQVKSTIFSPGEELCLDFENSTSIVIPLKQKDFRGPEAVMYQHGTIWWVIQEN